MKYQPQVPKRFGCIQDAKSFVWTFSNVTMAITIISVLA
jgi:hypothetical protein